ncbi:MAG: RHS repeat-associated core domain-containing protein [Vulcanimicrobiota bacterium]
MPLGRRSSATFDAQRNPLSATDPLGHTTRMTWDSLGSLTSVADNLGNRTTMEYDSKGFLKAIVLPATDQNGPARTTAVRNAADELIRSTDPLGRVYTYKRDVLGRVVEAISPAVQARYRQESLPPASTRVSFNRNDQQETVTSVDGRVTRYSYDAAERLVEVQETGYPAPTRLKYDAFDNLVSITRPNGAITTYEFDVLNRVTKVTYPGGDVETLSYDARGRVSEWHAGSKAVVYEYDNLDRLVHMSCASTGDDYRYTYDDADRLLSMQDQTGTTTYEYTGNDRLKRVTHPGNRSLTYGFDDGDRLISTLDPENVRTDYAYNQRNQLVRASHDGQTISYFYDLLGRAIGMVYPNGVRGQQVFDERDRLLYRDYRKGATPLVTLKYAYNQLGQRILDDRTMPTGNQLARFTYNQRLELTRSERDRGGCGPTEVHSYAYDLNHNITKKDGVSYTNNLADQLLSVAGQGSLTYNDAGQATNVQGWDVSYNCADQITGISAPGKAIAYRYDAAGQRVSKTVNGTTQNFLWNGGDIAKEYTSAGAVRADYFLAAGREGIKTNGRWYFYLSDIQGSTLMLTDSSGNSAATWDYSDYGQTKQTSGSTAMYNPFLYTGQEYDFETSLYHLRARHYSPSLSRFFARDPVGYEAGSNMMGYCSGDPTNRVDTEGLEGIYIAQNHRFLKLGSFAVGINGYASPFPYNGRVTVTVTILNYDTEWKTGREEIASEGRKIGPFNIGRNNECQGEQFLFNRDLLYDIDTNRKKYSNIILKIRAFAPGVADDVFHQDFVIPVPDLPPKLRVVK